jgi:hypothetical protein
MFISLFHRFSLAICPPFRYFLKYSCEKRTSQRLNANTFGGTSKENILVNVTSILDTGCSILDTGCSILDSGYSLMD